MFDLNSFFQTENTDYQAILSDIERGDGQLVDIREQVEWDQGHFAGAIHVPLSKLSRGEGIDKLKQLKNDNKRIFLHCLSGSRVRLAKQLLAGFGCTEVKILTTNMNTLRQNGFQLSY